MRSIVERMAKPKVQMTKWKAHKGAETTKPKARNQKGQNVKSNDKVRKHIE